MRKLLLGALFGLFTVSAFGADWTTAGNGTAYSLASLSAIEESGLSKVADNVYLLSGNITVKAGDSFTLEPGVTLRIAGSAQIRIECDYKLGDASARTLITRADSTATPKGIYIVYDGTRRGRIRNLDFEYASLRSFGSTGFDISDCSFSLSNGKLSSAGALTIGKAGASFTVSRCTFSENTVPAIGSGATLYCGLTISDCSIFDCTTENRNKPMINISVGGDSAVLIRNVNITGTGRNMVGGISINNMMSGKGTNAVTIDSVSIRDCRYGINGIGPQKLTVSRALLVDNHHEANPMNGGSGISLSSIGQEAVITGCRIVNSLWGVTLIKSPANLGQVGNSLSPGDNVFINNGNNGGNDAAQWKPYDLYNNSTYTVYAQNNTWSVPEQTQAEIETVIYHKNDNDALGEVNFMPAKQGPAIVTMATLADDPESGVTKSAENVYIVSKDVTVPADKEFRLDGGLTVRLADGVQIQLNGPASLGATGARTLVTRNAETDAPKGFYLLYDGPQTTLIRNLDFEYASLRNFGERGFDMQDCSFRLSNGKLNSTGAVSLGKSGANFRIARCSFSENSVPAIGGGANIYCGLQMSDCSLFDNNTANTNKPQINVTVGGDLPVVLRNINITGTGRGKVGGLAVGNMMSGGGANTVIIDSVSVRECRYGITGMGPQSMTISNCHLYNNNHETNPNAGGSGISLSSIGQEAVISGCHIENSLWGVTLIKSPANLGQVGNWMSPGLNVFLNNGNSGSGSYVPYDLYNNSSYTVFAQNNTWSVPEQTEAEIEKVIFHKNDNAALGEVIFMPAMGSGAVSGITSDEGMRIADGMITCPDATDACVYTSDGRLAARLPLVDGAAEIPSLPRGIYIVRAGKYALKVRM